MKSDFVFLKKLLVQYTAPSMRRGLLSLRDQALDVNARFRMLENWEGSVPKFIIIGTQKGGTTQMYDELIRHPQIRSALTKEVHFFDDNYDKGENWYRTFFPGADKLTVSDSKVNVITGEASPCYLFHPWAAKRTKETVPNVKLIVMLRNPVKRAYSHYHHEVRLGYETLSFPEAIEREAERLQGERTKMMGDHAYLGTRYMHYSYLARGRYVEQLRTWYEYFDPEQILVLSSENFYRNTESVLEKTLAFLGLPSQNWERQKSHKSFPYKSMSAETEKYLKDYFAPYNQQLYSFLDTDFGWD